MARSRLAGGDGHEGATGPDPCERSGLFLHGRATRTSGNIGPWAIKEFSETDFTEDLKKIQIPTLVVHGDADHIVPIEAASLRSAKLVDKATLKVYPGAPPGMCTTLADQVNTDLLAFIKG